MRNFLQTQQGFGLIAAVFVIVILAMFGTLLAKMSSISSTNSMEDYLWAQALYAAEGAAQLRILCRDDGGPWGGSANCNDSNTFPQIHLFDTSLAVNDSFTKGAPATIIVKAKRKNISREIEIKFLLE